MCPCVNKTKDFDKTYIHVASHTINCTCLGKKKRERKKKTKTNKQKKNLAWLSSTASPNFENWKKGFTVLKYTMPNSQNLKKSKRRGVL